MTLTTGLPQRPINRKIYHVFRIIIDIEKGVFIQRLDTTELNSYNFMILHPTDLHTDQEAYGMTVVGNIVLN